MLHKRLPPYVLIVAAILVMGGGVVSASDVLPSGDAAAALPPSAAALSAVSSNAAYEPGTPQLPSQDQSDTAVTVDPVGPDPEGGADILGLPVPRLSAGSGGRRYFPALLDPAIASSLPASYGADRPEVSAPDFVPGAPALPLLANNQILAFYGHPLSKRMGILGEYPKEDLCKLLKGYAKLYDEANGDDGVVPAFYLIYGTCWPGGEIGYLKDSIVRDYVEYAASQGLIVYIDHQIGKYTVEESMRRLLPWLKYPNVHLALDPEWRTTAPMEEIGSVTAEEVNLAQDMMRDYMVAQGIPGVRMLVVHQFRNSMITGRERVRADNDRVLLVHTADGFGTPALKKNTYANNALAGNMPLKGFKLFFKTTVPGAGYDKPLLTPPEVLALNPRPVLVIYQ